MRELDVNYQTYLRDLEQHQEALQKEQDASSRRKHLARVQQLLIASQEIGDEKVQLMQQIQDLVDNKARQLDVDYKNLGRKRDIGKDQDNGDASRDLHPGERQSKRARRTRADATHSDSTLDLFLDKPLASSGSSSQGSLQGHPKKGAGSGVGGGGGGGAGVGAGGTGGAGGTKKKKRKSKQDKEKEREDSPPDIPIDPDEPTYCLCDQVSYGEMIGCDNDLCPIEWFHFSCVSLVTKPKGKWYCPKCRGDRPNIMKPKAQFLKELEKFNREKEEKA